MKVRVRHIDDVKAAPFTEIHFSEADALISWVKASGSFYVAGRDEQPFHSYQLVHQGEDGEAYMEIMVGAENA